MKNKETTKLSNFCWECDIANVEDILKEDPIFCHECCQDKNCNKEHGDYDISPYDYKDL